MNTVFGDNLANYVLRSQISLDTAVGGQPYLFANPPVHFVRWLKLVLRLGVLGVGYSFRGISHGVTDVGT